MSTLYHSTRSCDELFTSKQAILQGIAADGGLFVCDKLAEKRLDLATMCQKTFQEQACSILETLLDDFTKREIQTCVEAAYGSNFDNEFITPVTAVSNSGTGSSHADTGTNTWLLELWHGPTSAFKDIALQMLPQLMHVAQNSASVPSTATATTAGAAGAADASSAPVAPAVSVLPGNTTTAVTHKSMIVTATSGDTGKAALAGFANKKNLGIVVFYPQEKVSDIQRLQMVTQPGYNVGVYAVKGNFDDIQTQVKTIFTSAQLAKKLKATNTVLSSANSINIGRLIPQIVYYFSAYAQLVKKGVLRCGQSIEFCVPTGNFGDVLAGWFAKQLGLPISQLIVAANANNVLFDFIQTGSYDRRRAFIKTISPSMDILVSSNLERLLYFLSDADTQRIATYMHQLDEKGVYTIDPKLHAAMKQIFSVGYASDEQTKQTIHQTWKQHRVLLDPHTAVAMSVLQRTEARSTCRVVLSTANPFKFSADVLEALTGAASNASCRHDERANKLDGFAAMDKLAELTQQTPPSALSALRNAKVLHSSCIEVHEMADVVLHDCQTKL